MAGLAQALACLGVEPLADGAGPGRFRPAGRGRGAGGRARVVRRPGGRLEREPDAPDAACPPGGAWPPRGRSSPRGAAPSPPVRSGRSARPTAWSRSSGWPRSGSGSMRPRSGRPSRGRSTSATASGSKTTRSSPARSPTRSSPCPTWRRSGSAWRGGVGLLVPEPRRATGSSPPAPEFWAENAIHLPQMIATRWLAPADLARAGRDAAGGEHGRAGPPLRPARRPALARHARPGRLGGPRRPRCAPRAASPRLGPRHLGRRSAGRRPRLRRAVAVGRGRRGQVRSGVGSAGRRRGPRVLLLGAGLPAWPRPGGRGDPAPGGGWSSSRLWAAMSWRWAPRLHPGRASSTSSSCSRTSRSSPIARGSPRR